jgi:hypothetical protein
MLVLVYAWPEAANFGCFCGVVDGVQFVARRLVHRLGHTIRR